MRYLRPGLSGVHIAGYEIISVQVTKTGSKPVECVGTNIRAFTDCRVVSSRVG